jgi:hypothetical protein
MSTSGAGGLVLREVASLRRLKSGYLLNLFGGPAGRVGNTIHPVDCAHVAQMKVPPRKIWADSLDELRTWIERQGGGLDPASPVCDAVLRR